MPTAASRATPWTAARWSGPTWQGLWESARSLADGTTVTADEAYLVESIRNPSVKLVEGFAAVMIPYDEATLSDGDVEALIAYLREETGAGEEAGP